MSKNNYFKYKTYLEYIHHIFDTSHLISENSHIEKVCKTITFQVTDRCNLCCDYCYEWNKKTSVMSFQTAKEIVDMLLNSYEKDEGYLKKETIGVVLDFIGGEPLLYPKLLEAICDYWFEQLALREIPFAPWTRISFATNGQNWFDEDVQHFINKYLPLMSVTVSIDGVKELHDAHRVDYAGHGSFDKAIRAFKDLKAKSGQTNSKMTFVPSSFIYIFDSIKFMVEQGCDIIYCNCAYEPVYTERDARILYQQLKKVADYLMQMPNQIYVSILEQEGTKNISIGNYCGGGGGSMVAFAPDGSAYPCVRYCPISLGEEKASKVKIGDQKGLYKTEEQREVLLSLKSNSIDNQSPKKCLDCPISQNCGWCSAYCYEVTGKLNGRLDNICWAHKASTLAAYYYCNKGYKVHDWIKPLKVNILEEDALKIIPQDEWEEIKRDEQEAMDVYYKIHGR